MANNAERPAEPADPETRAEGETQPDADLEATAKELGLTPEDLEARKKTSRHLNFLK
jgi:hypothetical protein